MSQTKTVVDQSFAAYRSDPNFTGAFVGGPPLMSPAQVQNLLRNPQAADLEAKETLRLIRKKLGSKS